MCSLLVDTCIQKTQHDPVLEILNKIMFYNQVDMWTVFPPLKLITYFECEVSMLLAGAKKE